MPATGSWSYRAAVVRTGWTSMYTNTMSPLGLMVTWWERQGARVWIWLTNSYLKCEGSTRRMFSLGHDGDITPLSACRASWGQRLWSCWTSWGPTAKKTKLRGRCWWFQMNTEMLKHKLLRHKFCPKFVTKRGIPLITSLPPFVQLVQNK